MKRIDITNGIMRIDTNTETFDIQKIQNRRFMYNPQTGTLILGIQTQCNDFFYKKVTEYRRIGIRSNFNEFVSGWVGSGKTGVILRPPFRLPQNLFLIKRLIRLLCFTEITQI